MTRTPRRRLPSLLLVASIIASSLALPAAVSSAVSSAAIAHALVRTVVAADIAPIPKAALTQTIAALRAKYGIPGMQATIIYDDGRAWTDFTGFANVRARIAPIPATPFAIGSITKTFVAALVLQLAAEGRLTLDAPAAQWLPGVAIDPGVTIRQLLSHTSGIYDFFSNPTIDAALTASKRSVWTVARDLKYVKAPYFPAGTDWHYSNTNYILLGVIASAVTGQTVPAMLRARFFGPLRLTSAVFQGVERPRIPVAHAYTFATTSTRATPVDQGDGTGISPFTSVVTAAGVAGAVAISSWDLARWSRALYTGKVLSPDLLAQMEDVSLVRSFTPTSYGLGMQETTIGGYTALGHGGRLIGTQAVMRYFPQLHLSIAVTTNQWRTTPDVVVSALVKLAAQAAVIEPTVLP